MALATCRIDKQHGPLCLDCATYTGKRRYGLPKKERGQECWSCQQMEEDRAAEELEERRITHEAAHWDEPLVALFGFEG